MRSFACDSCGARLFFENDSCLACGQGVGFRPDEQRMLGAETAAAAGYRPCRNWLDYQACNWYVDASAGEYCASCALNELVPDLSDPRRRTLWAATEKAKRRLVFTLLELRLPLLGHDGHEALRFRLLADQRVDTGAIDPPEESPIYTGHETGRLTLNVLEADDVHRTAVRDRLQERYRTVLGHLRHEVGHYYYYLLVEGRPIAGAFVALFGDPRQDYEQALARHYSQGPPPGWEHSFVSAYASVHPWEDFAETWAHYIHLLDTLETAHDSALALGERTLASPLPLEKDRPLAHVLEDWRDLTVCLNQLNRSLGVEDAYPFAPSDRIAHKFSFVHELCLPFAGGQAPAAEPTPQP